MDKIKRTFGFIFSHPLGKRHLLKSLLRFIVWQLQSSLSPSKLIIKPYVGDVKFYAKKGLTGITGNIYTGLHEFGDMGFLLHFLRPGDVFFDIGANVGSYTLLASGVCKAKTIAIEPVQTTFNMLQQNIILNNLQNKTQIKTAELLEKDAEITLNATKTQLQQNIEQAYVNLNSAQKRYDVLSDQVNAFKESFREAEVKFNAGVITSDVYLIAKNNYDNANINLIIARYDYVFRSMILDYYSGKLTF